VTGIQCEEAAGIQCEVARIQCEVARIQREVAGIRHEVAGIRREAAGNWHGLRGQQEGDFAWISCHSLRLGVSWIMDSV
jgi:hypothetical protein